MLNESPLAAAPAAKTRRWFLAGAASAVATVILFLLFLHYVNRDGCWFYFHERRDLLPFGGLFLWLLLLFALQWGGRVVLVLGTLLVVFIVPIPDRSNILAAEAKAIGGLRQLRSALEMSRQQHQQQGFPHKLPEVPLADSVQKLYRFQYVPTVSPSGNISEYLIEATPSGRCGCCETSFTIAEDGRVYFTHDARPANRADQAVD